MHGIALRSYFTLNTHMLTVLRQCTSNWKSFQTFGSNTKTTKKVPPVEIHRRMPAVYGDQCVDVSTVRRWVRWSLQWGNGFKNKTPFFKGRISKTSAAFAKVYWSAWWFCRKIIIYIYIYIYIYTHTHTHTHTHKLTTRLRRVIPRPVLPVNTLFHSSWYSFICSSIPSTLWPSRQPAAKNWP